VLKISATVVYVASPGSQIPFQPATNGYVLLYHCAFTVAVVTKILKKYKSRVFIGL
jgi:hypothetical protein